MSNITKAIAALGVVAGLGVAALPLSSYAATSQPVKVTATIDSNIAVSADTEDVNFGTIIVNGDIVSKTAEVTVTTNASKGYTLKVMPAVAGQLDMTKTDGTNDKIEAGTPTKGTSAWGIMGGLQKEYTGLTDAGIDLVDTTVDNNTATSDTGVTEVTFGITAANDQADGVYSNSVVFVATANK